MWERLLLLLKAVNTVRDAICPLMVKPFQGSDPLSSLDSIKQHSSLLRRQEQTRVTCWKKRYLVVVMVDNSSCRISMNEINFMVTIKLEIVKIIFFLRRKKQVVSNLVGITQAFENVWKSTMKLWSSATMNQERGIKIYK